MTLYKFIVPAVLAAGLCTPLHADVPLGLWESKPDRRGVVVHVRTKPCGQSICGRIERAKDRRGYDTPSNALGRRMLMDMQAQSDGSYSGKIWEPSRNRIISSLMRVQGNRMELHNCDGDACEDVVWTRLR
ncbi:hypothetical protein Z946_2927 [Sulfitobacter noctilucicola]|uniref:Uncharacterized protein (DUF2147 family) n=1 Tax=Sulfitobacter noctilucicola TaxID=1342301 RepID=A0A7W6MB94_9RHOB|nr:DUF2147 domain-containing protein [Sulfitobacter noctilucicola]KIN64042.1 hypothetical protein Z946_2927 [Sulfitobacter noctilucicola]MBB4175398.1 uncharacterized protein (DUF2147 family) [Sulfitobacter noctilucicola]